MKFLIVGLGSRLRGDDAIGPLVAEGLSRRFGQRISFRELAGEVASLVETIGSADRVWAVDAMHAGLEPGTLRRFDLSLPRALSGFSSGSNHGFGIGMALELLRNVGRLPKQLIVWGVECEPFSLGAGLSPRLRLMLPQLIESIGREIEEFLLR